LTSPCKLLQSLLFRSVGKTFLLDLTVVVIKSAGNPPTKLSSESHKEISEFDMIGRKFS